MGKTKTAFVSGTEDKLTGKEDYEKRKKEKEEALAKKGKSESGQKVHISGLKGGQRIVAIEAESVPETKEVESPGKTKKVPRQRSKKYIESKGKVDATKLYKVQDAIKLLKVVSYAKFDSTVELHLVVRKANLTVNVTLPHSTGKTKKVEVASAETLQKLAAGKIDFDVLLATAEMMPKLIPFAKLLGPKGLMPNPKNGTLLKTDKDAAKFSKDALNLKTEKSAPLIHTTMGKLSMDENDLADNITATLEAVNTKQIVKAYLSSTMSPSIKLAI